MNEQLSIVKCCNILKETLNLIDTCFNISSNNNHHFNLQPASNSTIQIWKNNRLHVVIFISNRYKRHFFSTFCTNDFYRLDDRSSLDSYFTYQFMSMLKRNITIRL